MPKVTIGLPTFNRAQTLKRSIELILNQTFHDFELIIYDDGSSDNTIETVQKFTDARISFYSFQNQGPPTPLNFILGKAHGDYIIFLHDHDHFRLDLVEKCVDSLDSNPEVGFALPAGITINENQNIIENPMRPPHEFQYINNGNFFLKKIFLQTKSFSSEFHACSMVRKSAMKKVGYKYKQKYGFYSDVELWLRLLKDFDFIYINEVLIQFTKRESDHQLNGSEILVLNSLYEIHSDSIHQLCFESIDAFSRILEKKYFNEVFWIIANIIANKSSGLEEQFKNIKAHSVDNRLRFFALKTLASPPIIMILPTLKRLIKLISSK